MGYCVGWGIYCAGVVSGMAGVIVAVSKWFSMGWDVGCVFTAGDQVFL